MHTTVLKILIAMGFFVSLGSVQSVTDEQADKQMPATEHQDNTLEIRDDSDFRPLYQFSRKSADYAAVIPVTQHQANVLQLQNVSSDDNMDGPQQQS
jgi:hypothetical protein